VDWKLWYKEWMTKRKEGLQLVLFVG